MLFRFFDRSPLSHRARRGVSIWKKYWTLLWLTTVLMSPFTAWADQSTNRLTLGDAIEAALARNPKIIAARHQADAAASQVDGARSGLLPQLAVSESYTRTNSPLWAFGTKLNQGAIQATDFAPDRLNDPEQVDNFTTALNLSWNLFDGGSTWSGYRQAQSMAQAASSGLDRVKQHVISQAAMRYVGLLLAMENRKVVDQALLTAQAHLKLIQDRHQTGLAVKSDVLRAQVRIADLEQQRLTADSGVQVAQAMLYAAMGGDETDPIDPQTPFDKCVELEGDLNHWVNLALSRRPDLKQRQLEQAVARKAVSRSKAGHWPRLALQGSYELNSEDFSDSHDNYTVGALLQLDLYSGQRTSSMVAAARANLAGTKATYEGSVLQVGVETKSAYFQAQSAWKSIAVARAAVEQADEGLRIVANRYSGGLLTIVDLLDAQVALQQARTQVFKALHDYKVARIDLALASGTIDKAFR
jgi:TolC family type I secretion outer membrane protein